MFAYRFITVFLGEATENSKIMGQGCLELRNLYVSTSHTSEPFTKDSGPPCTEKAVLNAQILLEH